MQLLQLESALRSMRHCEVKSPLCHLLLGPYSRASQVHGKCKTALG